MKPIGIIQSFDEEYIGEAWVCAKCKIKNSQWLSHCIKCDGSEEL